MSKSNPRQLQLNVHIVFLPAAHLSWEILFLYSLWDSMSLNIDKDKAKNN